MKFRPYAICPHTVAVQVVGLTHVAAEDVCRLVSELDPAVEHIVIHLPWHSMQELVQCLGRLQAAGRLPVQLHIMANTADEVPAYRGYGLPVAHGPASVYVSEHSFYPEDLPPTHTALYVAHFNAGARDDVKRQHLARAIPSLRVVTYPAWHDVPDGQYAAAFYATFPELGHADVNAAHLGPEQMREAYNRSQVSLALSRAEGCMYALTESLLCGTPAVSTPAFGGREQYFIAPFVTVVAPEPDLIAEAVRQMAARSHPRHRVRRRALAVLDQHRRRYCCYLESVCGCPAEDTLHRVFLDPRGADRLIFDFARSQPEEWADLETSSSDHAVTR